MGDFRKFLVFMELNLFGKKMQSFYRRTTTGLREQTGGPFTEPSSDSYRCDEDDCENHTEKTSSITTKDIYHIYGNFSYKIFGPKWAIVR
jgi:hypothetical protein